MQARKLAAKITQYYQTDLKFRTYLSSFYSDYRINTNCTTYTGYKYISETYTDINCNFDDLCRFALLLFSPSTTEDWFCKCNETCERWTVLSQAAQNLKKIS